MGAPFTTAKTAAGLGQETAVGPSRVCRQQKICSPLGKQAMLLWPLPMTRARAGSGWLGDWHQFSTKMWLSAFPKDTSSIQEQNGCKGKEGQQRDAKPVSEALPLSSYTAPR
jgi:hypothetical protein